MAGIEESTLSPDTVTTWRELERRLKDGWRLEGYQLVRGDEVAEVWRNAVEALKRRGWPEAAPAAYTPAQIHSLVQFAVAILAHWPEGDVEGCELQDIAESAGLLVPRTVTEPCGEHCMCVEYHGSDEMAEGVTCYRRATWLPRSTEDG